MKDIPQVVLLSFKVIPKASKTEIIGIEQEFIRVRLNAIPEKGEANTELIAFLAKKLKIGKSNIELVRGQTSRIKQLKVKGLGKEEIFKILDIK